MNYIEEILRLLKENNIMLKFICENIIAKEQNQDSRDVMNNVIGDWIANYIMNGNK